MHQVQSEVVQNGATDSHFLSKETTILPSCFATFKQSSSIQPATTIEASLSNPALYDQQPQLRPHCVGVIYV